MPDLSPSHAVERATRRELLLLYEHLPDAVVLLARGDDGGLTLASANRRMLALARRLGLRDAAVLRRGTSLDDLLAALGELHAESIAALRAGLDEIVTRRRTTRLPLDGVGAGALDLEATIVPATGRSGPLRLVLLLLRDTTEERAASQHRRALEAQLVRTEQLTALGTLAGGLAHDFGNVMTGIAGHAELLALDVEDNAAARESLQQIQAGLRRAQGLVNQVLAFARRRPPARRPLRLDALVQESLAFLAGRIPPSVRSALHADEAPPVLGDATQLAQAFDNLVTNAVQALDGRDGTVTVSIDTVALDETRLPPGRPAGRFVRLRIADDGPGIAPDNLARIFEPFFTTKRTGRGTGLGLAVVHGVVTAHEGLIDVESTSGHGTTFTIHLPAASTQTARTTPVGQDALPRGAGERVLVVDDEPLVVEATVRQLVRLGYRAVGQSDPAAALALVQGDPLGVDAVLTDYKMPGLDGGALARGVRAVRSDLPLVIMSANLADMPSADRALFAASLAKPFSSTTLAETLDAVTGTHRDD